MKVEKVIRVSINEEEYAILEKATDILQDICLAYDSAGQCEACPFYKQCERLPNTVTPHTLLDWCRCEVGIEDDSEEIGEI